MIGEKTIRFIGIPKHGDRLTLRNVVMDEVITYKSGDRQWYSKVISICNSGIKCQNYEIVNMDNIGVKMVLSDSFCNNSKNRPNFTRKLYKVCDDKVCDDKVCDDLILERTLVDTILVAPVLEIEDIEIRTESLLERIEKRRVKFQLLKEKVKEKVKFKSNFERICNIGLTNKVLTTDEITNILFKRGII